MRRRILLWAMFVIGLTFGIVNLVWPSFSLLGIRHEPAYLCMIFWTVPYFVAAGGANYVRMAGQAVCALLFCITFRGNTWGLGWFFIARLLALATMVYVFGTLSAHASDRVPTEP